MRPNRSRGLSAISALGVALVGGLTTGMLAPSASADLLFDFQDFDPNTNPDRGLESMSLLSRVGQASAGNAIQDGALRVVQPDQGPSAGAMWFNQRIDITQDFISTFTFRITPDELIAADGFAFVIQDQSVNALGAARGGLGYANNTVFEPNVGITNSLAVEFDTWQNRPTSWQDSAAPHAAIHSRGELSNSPDEADALIPGSRHLFDSRLDDGLEHEVTIAFLNGNFSVFFDDVDNPIISLDDFDIANTIGVEDGQAWIGLTSGHSLRNRQTAEILNWSLEAPGIPAPGSVALAALGGLVLSRRRR